MYLMIFLIFVLLYEVGLRSIQWSVIMILNVEQGGVCKEAAVTTMNPLKKQGMA